MSQLFAHPVLAPWLSDYVPPSSFAMETGESVPADLDANQILVPLIYELQCSSLESMISDGSASFAVLVTSPRTMVRTLYRHNDSSTREETVVLSMSDFAHDITLTPFVTTTRDVKFPVTDEHDVEFHEARGAEFALSAGAVLATGDGVRLSGNLDKVTSIIDIVASYSVEPGQFMLDYEDTRIKVLVNAEDRHALKTMRTGSPIARTTLYPGLYLHAVIGAIARLSDHRETAWGSVVASALEELGLADLDNDHLVEYAHIYAQQLLEAPLGHLLSAFCEAGDDS